MQYAVCFVRFYAVGYLLLGGSGVVVIAPTGIVPFLFVAPAVFGRAARHVHQYAFVEPELVNLHGGTYILLFHYVVFVFCFSVCVRLLCHEFASALDVEAALDGALYAAAAEVVDGGVVGVMC